MALSVASVPDQLFRAAVLCCPFQDGDPAAQEANFIPSTQAAAERCRRYVEAYVTLADGDEQPTLRDALDEVVGFAGYIHERFGEVLRLWCELCDEAIWRDHGLTVVTTSMLAPEQPDIRQFAQELSLPYTDMAGRLHRLHQQYCPQYSHPHVPRLILSGLPNLGFFL